MSLILSHHVAARFIYIATRELISLDWPARERSRRSRSTAAISRNLTDTGYVEDKIPSLDARSWEHLEVIAKEPLLDNVRRRKIRCATANATCDVSPLRTAESSIPVK